MVQQGATGTFTLTINALQPTSTEVPLINDRSTLVRAPTSVMVPANQTQALFNVTGLAAGTSFLTASLNASSAGATVEVQPLPPPPSPPPPPQVLSLAPNPLPLQQGATGQLMLTISAVQPRDTVVPLMNDQPTLVQTPISATVLAGQTQATVLVTAFSSGNAVLTAPLNGNVSATVQVATLPSPISGPLRILNSNPRYFTDGTGKAIYLTGSHTWGNLQDNGTIDPPPAFNYTAYLDWLRQHNHNFIRLGAWEQANFTNEIAGDSFVQPNIYRRVGPDPALDGKHQVRCGTVRPSLF
ncbi:MAG: hypothetical protein AB1555_18955 [Nitrospirota bacterium]